MNAIEKTRGWGRIKIRRSLRPWINPWFWWPLKKQGNVRDNTCSHEFKIGNVLFQDLPSYYLKGSLGKQVTATRHRRVTHTFFWADEFKSYAHFIAHFKETSISTEKQIRKYIFSPFYLLCTPYHLSFSWSVGISAFCTSWWLSPGDIRGSLQALGIRVCTMGKKRKEQYSLWIYSSTWFYPKKGNCR